MQSSRLKTTDWQTKPNLKKAARRFRPNKIDHGGRLWGGFFMFSSGLKKVEIMRIFMQVCMFYLVNSIICKGEGKHSKQVEVVSLVAGA